MIIRLHVLPAVALLLLLGGRVGADSQDPPVFSASAELVVLHVNVQDRQGGFLTDLPAEAFAVFEDGQPQEIDLFANQDTPVTTGLLIDNSISMRESRALVIAAAVEFARASHERDDIFAIAFNENVTPVLPPASPFTSDPVVLGNALTRSIVARGQTALFDAVTAGLAYAERGAQQRRVLVVISDGGDNASSATFEQVIRGVQASNVTIYTVTLADPLDRDADPDRMARLAEASGGETYTPRNQRQVAGVLQEIARDIRHTYTIGYSPARAPDDTFRKVRVIVSPPNDERLIVRTRGGYMAERRTAREHREP
jgi:VWFA-related protein